MITRKIGRFEKRTTKLSTIRHFSLVLFLAACTGCSMSTSYVSKNARVEAPISRLCLTLDMDEGMDFMGSRLLPELCTAVNLAGALGGPLGQGLVAANIQERKASEDKIVSDNLNSKVRVDFKGMLLEALQNDLTRAGKVEKVEIVELREGQQNSIAGDAILQITIPSWGLKKTQDDSLLKVFADTRIRFKALGQDKMEIDEQQVVAKTVNRQIADYEADFELLNKDIEDMLKTTSQRIVEVVFK